MNLFGRWTAWALVFGLAMLFPLACRWKLLPRLLLGFLVVLFFVRLPALLIVTALLFAVWQSIWWASAKNEQLKSPAFLLQTAVLLIGWIAAYCYFAWAYDVSVVGRGAVLSFVLAAALLAGAPLLSKRLAAASPHENFSIVQHITIGLGIFWLVLEAFRTDRIEVVNFFHHWGVFVGPVQQIRTGGWLLWDVPAQYGFLTMVLTALMPFKSAWTSLYVINAFFVAAQGVLLFLFVRRAWPTIWGTLVALGLTFFSMHLIAGWMPDGLGISSFPSVSGFRFFWVMATLVYLTARPAPLWAKKVENILFLIAAFWSPECFLYIGLAWAAFYWGTWLSKTESLKNIAKQIAIKAALVISAVIFISAGYRLVLGHFPDWFMFIEYAVGFGGGFGQLPMRFPGPVLGLLYFVFVFGLLLVMHRDALRGRLGPILSCCAAFWACATYYVSRSHPSNATNLAPLLLLASAGLVNCVSDMPNIKGQLLLWLSPLIGGLFLTAVLNRPLFPQYVKHFPQISFGDVERFIPAVDDETQRLLQKIPKLDETRFVSWREDNFAGRYGENLLGKTWLPLSPMALGYPLRESRKPVFVQRRLERANGCGLVLYGPRYPRTAPPIQQLDQAFAAAGWTALKSYTEGQSEAVYWCHEKSVY